MSERKYHIYELLSEDGLGVTTEAIGDYSTPASWQYISTYNSTEIHRVIISISDATINNTADYGGIGALTNGVLFYHRDSDDNIIETLTPFGIKSNEEWSAACFDVEYNTLGAGSDMLTARWTFAKAGFPIELKIGEYIEAALSDDFTGLITHKFFVQGKY